MKKTLLTTIASLIVATTFSQRTVYVDIDATGTDNGTSWANAYNEPQDAFDNASKGDNIWVAEGTYALQTTLRNSSFGWNKDSVSVYGGFDGTETALSQRDWSNNSTIFSGEIQGDNDSSNNSYTVFMGPFGNSSNKINYSLIDGITISDGYGITTTTNYATRWGAGFYLQDYVRNLTINNCVFTNNTAQGAAAMYVSANADSSDVFVTNTKFIDNKSSFANCIWGQATISNPLNLRIINCLFSENVNDNYGGVLSGGLFYFSSNGAYANLVASIVNSTITYNRDNVTSSTLGQIIMFNKSHNSQSTAVLEVANSILYNNSGFGFNTKKYNSSSSYDFTAASFISCISEIFSYAVNTNRVRVYNHDPLFTDPSTRDFTLLSASPAIDSGSTAAFAFPTHDLAGLARIKGATIDLGCYEYQTITAGVKENKEFASLNLFPNPTTGSVTFESKEEIETIEIFSLTGQKVKSFSNSNRIDISEFTPGVYMARVIAGNKVSTKRIIKQ